ncbi:MAG: hypothetical protein IK000_03800 [Bacteroidaceae bacterium]|nr:hypothetical protein [Bacteroidaceae bacterium]
MKKEADTIHNKVRRKKVTSCEDTLLDTILAAFPMDGDRQQAEHSWQLFVQSEEKSARRSCPNSKFSGR